MVHSWKGQVDDLLTKYKPIYVSDVVSYYAVVLLGYGSQDQLEALDVLKSESSFAHAEVYHVVYSVCLAV